MQLNRRLSYLMGIVALLATLVGRPESASAAATWKVVPSPNGGSRYNDLAGVTAVSSSDVWAVGNSAGQTGPYRTLAEHWNGTTWKIVPTPNVGSNYNFLNGVGAVTAIDVWAVGQSYVGQYLTLIEHWDGTSWKVVASPLLGNGDSQLNAVAKVSATDVWAVGSTGSNRTLIEHWNGISWSVVPSPSVGTGRNSLAGLAVVSATDIWAVGRHDQQARTLIEHWNGSLWTVVPSPNPTSGDNNLFSAAAVSASDVWAVGSKADGTQTLAEHWNGTAWTAVNTPNPVGSGTGNSFLTGVAALSSSNVWSVGTSINFVQGSLEQTVGEHWNGTGWSVASTPNSGTGSNALNQAAALSGGTVWAVGHYSATFGGPQRTLILEMTPK